MCLCLFLPLFLPQDAIIVLLKELEAASCRTGPAPQRLAHFFASALSSRLLGDGMAQYMAEASNQLFHDTLEGMIGEDMKLALPRTS